MSALTALEQMLTTMDVEPIDAEMARALAQQIDDGKGVAAAVKELGNLLDKMADREPTEDGLDELARKRAERRAG